MKKTLPILSAVCAAAALMFSACSGGSTYTGAASGSTGEGKTEESSEEGTESSSTGGANTSATTASKTIKLSDEPTGFASLVYSGTPSSYTVVTVSNRQDLITKAKLGNHVIYVDGMIDMTNTGSGTMIPSTAGGTTAALDAFVAAQSTTTNYADYNSWRNTYVKACTTSTNNNSSNKNNVINGDTWTLNEAYKKVVQIDIASNTIIIGKTSDSGTIGGSFNIGKSGETRSNIIIRNMTIQDAYDPFPHHEADDGYNAERDGLVIQQDTAGIWIDHCTFKDTKTVSHVYTGATSDSDVINGGSGTDEKWQTYDGLLDIKGTASGVTISNCKFMNHDKSLFLCSEISDTGTKNITFDHNYFYGTKQRLPMVGHANLHTYNNYFSDGDGTYTNDYAIGLRYAAQVVSENNYFTDYVKYSYKNLGSLTGKLYKSGDNDNSSSGVQNDAALTSCTTTTRSDLFAITYDYTLDTASTLPTLITANAGAGKWAVEQ